MNPTIVHAMMGVLICAVLGAGFAIVYRHKSCDGRGCGSCGESCEKAEGAAPSGAKGDRR